MGHSKKRKRSENSSENQTSDNASNITRRARIIVRNLPFKTTEKDLKEHFEKFGPVTEVNLLKRPDGKLVGCGFIQYQVVQNAAQAIFHTNGKPFLGREIVCDWALGKNTYVKNIQEALKAEIKEEDLSEVEVKKEDDDENDVKVKMEEDEVAKKEKSEDLSDDESEKESSDDESDSENESVDAKSEFEEPETKRPRIVSNDVQEGKTIFIKNVPFSADNEDVKHCLEQFGSIYYALVCTDKITEHSKGTAFVKFVNKEDADKCLEAGTELTLMGQILDCHPAVSKNELDNKNNKEITKKDSRNLYLVKEGVILAGTKAAEGVSASDMAKRLDLEKWKTQMLRNLNMFISKQRLIIHNLPVTYDDKRLRELFVKYVGANAMVKEAKVMRNMRNLDDKGKAISKEYGFVSFAYHDDALRAIRAINNNPDIFSRTKRPIVAFSIENRAVINVRNKRLQKSKLHNPLSKEYDSTSKETKSDKPNQKGKDQNQNEKFTGVTSTPGKISKMRSKFKLTTQAQMHHEQLKKEKKTKKLRRKHLNEKRKEFIRQSQQKKGKQKKQNADNFSKLENTYKKNISSQNKTKKKSKWYENK